MIVNSTDIQNNFGRYLSIVAEEDIFITKNGKNIAKLSRTTQDKVELAKSLFGIIPSDTSLEQAKEERLSRYESAD
jgi:antitoxin (DNA-binding transcriptional repressor) of toxin-antitoxin stability system